MLCHLPRYILGPLSTSQQSLHFHQCWPLAQDGETEIFVGPLTNRSFKMPVGSLGSTKRVFGVLVDRSSVIIHLMV